ncbi:MAG: carbamoyltransferase HypF [Gemmatimonadaceae bacterium]|nr:carbamoyltransferase HypF [Gemmatimonadaceae bacterium]
MSFPSVSAPAVTTTTRRRIAIRLDGIVQGVGFRPYVHRLAVSESLSGSVCNAGSEVLVDVEGESSAVDRFLQRLPIELPGAARIDHCHVIDALLSGQTGFSIAPSRAAATHVARAADVAGESCAGGRDASSDAWRDLEPAVMPIAPDLATCDDCWSEFHDPANRRYHYPFLNCTQCGPRYTIVTGVPYDRARTTMARFAMCVECQREYDNPADRRFHAEPTACRTCGPQLIWRATPKEVSAESSQLAECALHAAHAVLQVGGVIAAKGLGGYHLLCRADNHDAVARLRRDKARPDKPLAILAATLDDARRMAEVSDAAARALTSPAHPIVLLPRREHGVLADNIAPGLDEIGIMLPALPLHALLATMGPLVCTSGNLSEEPIAWRDIDALGRLSNLVDGVLTHERDIVLPCDDSVVRVDHAGHVTPLRRARGYAPLAIKAGSVGTRGVVLAVGAELKSAPALLWRDQVVLAPHLGDVASPDTLDALTHATERLETSYGASPDVIACDLHPDYLSSRWAVTRAAKTGRPVVRVQHHHAHLAALHAEGVARRQIASDDTLTAFTFDGTGYGPDGTIWGGEVLRGNAARFERLASLRPFLLPGGDAAVRQPWRSALGVLTASDCVDAASMLFATQLPHETLAIVRHQLDRQLACASTTSMGRWFDACAALCGIALHVTYEGQAAMHLEALAARCAVPHKAPRYRFHITHTRFDFAPVVHALLDDVAHLRSRGEAWGSNAFAALAYAVHDAVAHAMRALAAEHAPGASIGLTGGVFQNRLLTRLAAQQMESAGHAVLTHRLVPCNDGGLALGQALIASHAHSARHVIPT